MFVFFPLSLEYPLRILIASRYKKREWKKKTLLQKLEKLRADERRERKERKKVKKYAAPSVVRFLLLGGRASYSLGPF